MAVRFEDEIYHHYDMAAFINIPDAAGHRFTFDVSHFDEGGREDEFGTFEQLAQLDIYVNNDSIASVSHGLDPNEKSTSVEVTCNSYCECSFSN